MEISKKKETPNGKKVKENSSPAGKVEPKVDAKLAKDKLNNDAKIVANGKPSADKPPTNGETVAKQRFAAHRKFAQNCQQFTINTKPVDFKEKQQSAATKLSAAVKQPPAALNTDLFSNFNPSTDEFLAYLCFRDLVSLPFGQTDKEAHTEKDSAKFETRKENADLLAGHDKDSTASSSKTRETFKENSKKKLNGSKIKQEDTVVKEESKVNGKLNRPNANKSNGNAKSPGKLANGKLNGKLNAAKLQQLKSQQLKNSPAKVSQMKSQKLTKLAKLNKVKSVDKKAEPSGLKMGKKKVDIKVEPSASRSPDNKTISKPFTITSDTIKDLLKKSKESIKKKPQLKTTGKTKNEPKASDKASAKQFKLPEKPKKEFNKLKKEEVKTKKKFLNTRQLRNGSIHHYKGKQ